MAWCHAPARVSWATRGHAKQSVPHVPQFTHPMNVCPGYFRLQKGCACCLRSLLPLLLSGMISTHARISAHAQPLHTCPYSLTSLYTRLAFVFRPLTPCPHTYLLQVRVRGLDVDSPLAAALGVGLAAYSNLSRLALQELNMSLAAVGKSGGITHHTCGYVFVWRPGHGQAGQAAGGDAGRQVDKTG